MHVDVLIHIPVRADGLPHRARQILLLDLRRRLKQPFQVIHDRRIRIRVVDDAAIAVHRAGVVVQLRLGREVGRQRRRRRARRTDEVVQTLCESAHILINQVGEAGNLRLEHAVAVVIDSQHEILRTHLRIHTTLIRQRERHEGFGNAFDVDGLTETTDEASGFPNAQRLSEHRAAEFKLIRVFTVNEARGRIRVFQHVESFKRDDLVGQKCVRCQLKLPPLNE